MIVAADYCKGGPNGAVGALSQCSAQCAPLLRGYGSCQNVSPCLCPTVSTAGVPCSECLAGINSGDAAVVGSIISQCGGLGNRFSTPQVAGVSVTPTITVAATGSYSSGSAGAEVSGQATSVSHSGGEGVYVGTGGQYVMYIVLLPLVALMGLIA